MMSRVGDDGDVGGGEPVMDIALMLSGGLLLLVSMFPCATFNLGMPALSDVVNCFVLDEDSEKSVCVALSICSELLLSSKY